MMQKINHIIMEYPWKYNKSGFEPYCWMVNDLYRGIQAEQNYLVALGLFSYSEYLWRIILGNIGTRNNGWKCFKKFTENYIGYSFYDWEKIFDNIRNWLAHRYFIKTLGWVYNDNWELGCWIKRLENGELQIYIHSYFKHFVKGLEKYLDEKYL